MAVLATEGGGFIFLVALRSLVRILTSGLPVLEEIEPQIEPHQEFQGKNVLRSCLRTSNRSSTSTSKRVRFDPTYVALYYPPIPSTPEEVEAARLEKLAEFNGMMAKLFEDTDEEFLGGSARTQSFDCDQAAHVQLPQVENTSSVLGRLARAVSFRRNSNSLDRQGPRIEDSQSTHQAAHTSGVLPDSITDERIKKWWISRLMRRRPRRNSHRVCPLLDLHLPDDLIQHNETVSQLEVLEILSRLKVLSVHRADYLYSTRLFEGHSNFVLEALLLELGSESPSVGTGLPVCTFFSKVQESHVSAEEELGKGTQQNPQVVACVLIQFYGLNFKLIVYRSLDWMGLL
ncbi:hypothetical protein R1sor_013891 [Riccia sorocarpa]|uniref:Uncharacterized protein n=1 Tax=Riccia sorocarpa TaxID=122646 RepID=A0ABD3HAW2_9MARC